MRLIDGDKLIRKYIDTDIEKFSNSDVKIVLENLKQNILKAPSIDICFCKECRYCKKKRGTFKGEPIIFYRCTENNRDVEADDCCSWGERSRQ